jgi:hypothetical protein
MIYNPTLVRKERIGTLCSQIDYPPTLLSLLNWSYRSRFFGKDILKMKPEEERAFIASYQKLGILNGNQMAVLKPVREHSVYSYERTTGDLTEMPGEHSLTQDGIAYYQAASCISVTDFMERCMSRKRRGAGFQIG